MEAIHTIQLLCPVAGYAGLLFVFGAILLFNYRETSSFTCVNLHPWDMFQSKAKEEFQSSAGDLIKEGLQKVR